MCCKVLTLYDAFRIATGFRVLQRLARVRLKPPCPIFNTCGWRDERLLWDTAGATPLRLPQYCHRLRHRHSPTCRRLSHPPQTSNDRVLSTRWQQSLNWPHCLRSILFMHSLVWIGRISVPREFQVSSSCSIYILWVELWGFVDAFISTDRTIQISNAFSTFIFQAVE